MRKTIYLSLMSVVLFFIFSSAVLAVNSARVDPATITIEGQQTLNFVITTDAEISSFVIEGSFDPTKVTVDSTAVTVVGPQEPWSKDESISTIGSSTFKLRGKRGPKTTNKLAVGTYTVGTITLTPVQGASGSTTIITLTSALAGINTVDASNLAGATITITGAADPCATVTCQNGGTCSDGLCSCVDDYTGTNCEIAPQDCTAETDAAFCSRLGKNCGSVTANDNCGTSRTTNCGSCSGGQTCDTDNVCAAPSDKAAQKIAACEQITAATEGPTGWTPQWVSQLAQKLKKIFS